MKILNRDLFQRIKLKKLWFIYLILLFILNRFISDAIGDNQEAKYIENCATQWQRALNYQNEMVSTSNINIYVDSGLLFTHFWTTLPFNKYEDDECFNNLIDELVKDSTIAYVELKEAERQLASGSLISVPDLPFRVVHKKMEQIIVSCNNMNVLFLDFYVDCKTIWDS
jgi:hypothetical protein